MADSLDSEAFGISRRPSSLDDEQLEILQELHTPLEDLYPEEFERYLDLFYRYWPKKPYHYRRSYDSGFVQAKGKYRTSSKDHKPGDSFARGCYPGEIAKMLDIEQWQRAKGKPYCQEHYWIGMHAPKASTLSAIDFDAKPTQLGYYTDLSTKLVYPVPLLTLEHFQMIKRIYDNFPGVVWCISSATLGLHVWHRYTRPIPLDHIHATMQSALYQIGLGGTEVHPMHGRCFRRPFGQDYYTITEEGLLGNWIKQLDHFQSATEAPSFKAIYRGLRGLMVASWKKCIGPQPQRTFQGNRAKLIASNSSLAVYYTSDNKLDLGVLGKHLGVLDEWAEGGFSTDVVSGSSTQVPEQPTFSSKPSQLVKEPSADLCAINLSEVCRQGWFKTCQSWAINGLPCHDSIFLVVSQLARWLFFIELWDLEHDRRVKKINDILTAYVLRKHNGFVSRITSGLHTEVIDHIPRIVETAINNTDAAGRQHFANTRRKRREGKYGEVIYLEPVLLSQESNDDFSKRVQHRVNPTGKKRILSSNLPLRQQQQEYAQSWNYIPDDTPLPQTLIDHIGEFYNKRHQRLQKRTMAKLIRFINDLYTSGGEFRRSLPALKKMGFSNDRSRQHVKNLERIGVIIVGGYYPAGGLGTRYALTPKAQQILDEERTPRQ